MSLAGNLATFSQELRRRSAVLYWVGIGHLVLGALLLAAMPFDQGTVLGIDRLIKPFKFAVSIWIYTWTFGWMTWYLRSVKLGRILCWIVAATMVIEIVPITGQALRGTISHYNMEDSLGIAVYSLMGTAIGINSLCGVVLFAGLLSRAKELPAAYLLGLRLGLVLFLLGSAVGGALVVNQGHTVGAEDGGAGIPLLNWSSEAGDLRVAHALGLHALQIVPLFAFFLVRRTTVSSAASRWWVAGFALLYAMATVALYLQAMAGQPLI